ncbi:MAG: ATP-binding protein [Bacillota bacterium]
MNSSLKINVAGVLLYSESPQAIIPKRSAIRILRYHSDMKEGSRKTLDTGYPISIEGDIYTLISEAVKKTKQIVEETNVVGLSGMESKKYPDVALHEIITNAVLHRDYSIAADIQIRIFTDRLEIESPGKLPGHITIENILSEQFSRNAKIVRLISKFPCPPNKDAGEGLNSAFDAMVSMDLKKPVIKEKDNSVLVIIKHERLADHEVIILDYLKKHSSISNSEGRKLTGITDTIKMKDVFARLRSQGSIELVPEKKGNASRWQLANESKKGFKIREGLADIQDNCLQLKMDDF